MEGKIVFGKREAISFLIIAISNQLFLNFPRSMAETVGTAGWILTIYVTILSLLFFLIISKLFSKFEGKDIVDIGEFVGGSVLRVIIGLIIVIDYVFIISVILREYGEDLKIIGLTRSPIGFVLFIFSIGMAIGAYYGIEALVRLGAMFVPIIAIGFIIVIIGSMNYLDISNIMPVLGKGPIDIFIKGASKISVFSRLSILFLMVPFLGSHENFKKVGIAGTVISALFLIMGTLVYSLVFPYPTSTSSFLPIYELARLIDYGRFFQRIESVFVLVWSAAALLYLSGGLFFVAYIFKKAFRLEYHRPLIIPFAIIVLTVSLMPQSLMQAIELDTNVIRVFAWTVTFGMTLVLLLIATLIKKKKEGGVKNEK